MASKKLDEQNKDIPEIIEESIGAIAKGLGVAASELWKIFVKQYIARGVAELFTAIVLCVASFFLFPVIGLWILIPLSLALVLCYGTILLLVNPQYYAIEDIKDKVVELQNEKRRNLRGW